MYPFKPKANVPSRDQNKDNDEDAPSLTGLASKTWFAKTEFDAARDKDGKFKYGWHWNMPYKVKRDLPDWYMKEIERYSY